MANQGETRNAIVKNVQLYWMNNLAKPSSPFGEEIYDLQVRVPKERAAELAEFGKVREIDGMAVINVRKKAFKADGTPSKKPSVVDGSKEPLDPRTVGNGSVGNIRLRLNDYQILHPKTGKVTKEGTKVTLEAVQVTKLIVFTPTSIGDFNDFDEEETEIINNEQDTDDDEYDTLPQKPAAKKAVNAGLAAYQAKKAAEKAAQKKPAAKTVATSTKAPAKAPVKQSRGNSDY